jgi:hypothetical protein
MNSLPNRSSPPVHALPAPPRVTLPLLVLSHPVCRLPRPPLATSTGAPHISTGQPRPNKLRYDRPFLMQSASAISPCRVHPLAEPVGARRPGGISRPTKGKTGRPAPGIQSPCASTATTSSPTPAPAPPQARPIAAVSAVPGLPPRWAALTAFHRAPPRARDHLSCPTSFLHSSSFLSWSSRPHIFPYV